MHWRAVSIGIAGVVVAAAVMVSGAAINYFRDQEKKSEHAIRMTGGDPRQAQPAMTQYGCAACHQIPGTRSPGGLAGPPLSGINQRLYVGGVVENTPDNLVRWIVNPKQFSSRTAMPVTGISEAEARNVAAYLYTR